MAVSLRGFLVSSLALAVLIPLLLGMSFAASQSKHYLTNYNAEKLIAIRDMKGQQIEKLFSDLQRHLFHLSKNPVLRNSLEDFSRSFAKLELPPESQAVVTQRLTDLYRQSLSDKLSVIRAQPVAPEQFVPRSDKAKALQLTLLRKLDPEDALDATLQRTLESTGYAAALRNHENSVANLFAALNLYDLFLIEPEEGHIVFSLGRELDLGTSLVSDPFNDTPLATAFRKALEAPADQVTLSDFRPYSASMDQQAAFAAIKVVEDGRLLGVIAVQVPITTINQIMTSQYKWASRGMGESGEVYLLGEDGTMRNDSRFLVEEPAQYFQQLESLGAAGDIISRMRALGSSIGLQTVETEPARRARSGEAGVTEAADYRGVQVLSAFRPLEISGLNWVILSEIDYAEIMAQRISRIVTGAIVTLVLTLAMMPLIWIAARRIYLPVITLTGHAENLGGNRLSNPIPETGFAEIAELSRSFELMRQRLAGSFEELQSKNTLLEQARTELGQTNRQLESQNDELRQARDDLVDANHRIAISRDDLLEANDKLNRQNIELKRTQKELAQANKILTSAKTEVENILDERTADLRVLLGLPPK